LKVANRGTLNSTQTGITLGSGTFNQCWTLDATGNWKGFREDDTGSGAWGLIQSRSANPVNEISGITNSVGSAWAQPAYDKAGNMTTIPQPATPSSNYTGTYDAWNRLVTLVDPSSGNTVQTNAYDGRNYRTIRNSFTAGVLSETRHCFYTAAWQSIEERVGMSSSAERQFVWGLRSIDDVLLRDRDTTANGALSERFFALRDPIGSIVAAASSSRVVIERYAFAPYGAPTFATANFIVQPSTLIQWETQFAGYRTDLTTHLFALRERYLHFITGNFLQRDVAEYDESSNLYEYVRSNPLRFVDPFGTNVVDVLGECDICGTYTPPFGPIDPQFCGLWGALFGGCCTTNQTSSGKLCCKRKGQVLSTCTADAKDRINVFTCKPPKNRNINDCGKFLTEQLCTAHTCTIDDVTVKCRWRVLEGAGVAYTIRWCDCPLA
jgi:RHS repeat-associated protein